MARRVECRTDRAHASVHHVRRRDDVRARFRLCHSHRGEDLDRHVVHDDALVVDIAVVSIAGVGIHRDIRDDGDLRNRILDRAHGLLEEAVGVRRFRGALVLDAVGQRREKRHGRNAELRRLLRLLDDQVAAQPEAIGHRLDRDALPATFAYEERQDEVRRRDRGLADEVADRRGAAVATGANGQVHHGLVQSSTRTPGIFAKSLTLCVTTMAPRDAAVAAITRSSAPTICPFRSRSTRICA